ncbi:Rha family transcriptional regulator [Methylosinus sp. RM1]|uniref:Rha family transcriptional regulator n=1 Tax=Methylosinus sp. RM1 TaxID=2583817 RepID=UPI00140AC834|nr:Rha family transcriptional regulator [Methylosinus sp. RM1]
MSHDQNLDAGAPAENLPVESLVSISDGAVLADSRQVADVFGKRHDNVLRDIDGLLQSSKLGDVQKQWFREISHPHPTVPGRAIRSFALTRDGFALLAFGFTGEDALVWKIKFIEAFNVLETELGLQRVVGSEESESAPAEFLEHCRRRFKDIFSGDFISPDYLLKILFVGNIPYTGNKRFPLLAKESCEALGIGNKDAALRRLPALAKGFVTVDFGGGPTEREAITEAALYALAFDRRQLNTAWPAGPGGLFPYDIAAHSDAVALSYQIKTLESYFRSFRESVSPGAGLDEIPAFHNFERVISSAAQAADQQLTVGLPRRGH